MTDIASANNNALTPAQQFSAGHLPTLRKVLEIAGWLMVAGLLYTGLFSIFERAAFLNEAFAQEIGNPREVFNPFDVRYYEHFIATWSHLGLGLLIFVLGPFQFIPQIRKNWINFHRWSGRVWLVCGFISASTGIYIGVFYPFMDVSGQGFNESMATAFLGAYTFFCLSKAYTTIRAKKFGAHREWMIRSFGLMLAIATERVMLGYLLSNSEVGISVLFGTTFWMAGILNIAASEIWINLTRTPGNGAQHWKMLDAKTKQ